MFTPTVEVSARLEGTLIGDIDVTANCLVDAFGIVEILGLYRDRTLTAPPLELNVDALADDHVAAIESKARVADVLQRHCCAAVEGCL